MVMRAGNGSRGRTRRANGKQVPSILRAAFVHALKSAQYSEARAARSMGTGRSTVERYVSGQSDVNAKHVLESSQLWRPFWLCVGRLMHQARGGDRKRTAPRIARVRRNRG